MKSFKFLAVALGVFAIATSTATATTLYGEAFNSSAADVTILEQPDTTTNFVDYSNFTVGSTSFSIPESPRMIPGSDPTRGILIRANSDDATPREAAVNIIAGNVPITFTGNYRVSFDAYMNVPILDDGMGGVTLPGGSTEQLLWGVGTGDFIVEARNTRNSGTLGTWGWLDNENGYGTEDAAIFENGTELADLGDTQGLEAIPFNAAFEAPIVPDAPNNAAGNQWVEVDVDVVNGNVSVYFKGPTAAQRVLFFSEASAATEGAVMLGYEDPFSSITTEPDGMWGLFDNFVVTQIPEPSSALLGLFGLGWTLLARRKR